MPQVEYEEGRIFADIILSWEAERLFSIDAWLKKKYIKADRKWNNWSERIMTNIIESILKHSEKD